ncbi:MAG: hypothetical protein KJO91_05970 [Gammaproteobacteria bacterium]|nr:hypothetical protein [Gammaproteobacteria bacterium]
MTNFQRGLSYMNERVLLIAKIMLLCAGCLVLAATVIYILKEWLGWL